MVYIPNWCSFSPISTSRLVIPLKQPREEKKISFPQTKRLSSVCSCSVRKHGSDLLLCAAVTEPVGRPGPQTHKLEEISVPCQPTASADGTDAFSLLPVDSHSLIFHTKLPTAGLLILFYLSFWHLLLRPIKFDMCGF